MMSSKATKENKSVDQKPNNSESDNATQDCKGDDAGIDTTIDVEAGLIFILSVVSELYANSLKNQKENQLKSHRMNLPT